MSICIIGAGATGLLLLLLIQETGFDLSKITIIDPYFDGGDLARKWTPVNSNTPWSKTVDSLKSMCPSLNISTTNDPASSTPLVDIAHLIRNLSMPVLKRVRIIQGTAQRCDYTTSLQAWTIHVEAGGVPQEIHATKLILAPGSNPKTMNLSIPSIPLEVALDISRAKHYIKPGDNVVVFGTMHSGTLVAHNAVTLGANVSAYYKSPEPFYWARDNAYDGIKGEAADIADKIVSGAVKVDLVPTTDIARVIRTSHDAHWVVYAMGFTPRITPVYVDGKPCSSVLYNGQTGRLSEVSAWGFGIAYPNRAPDGIHWDVSVASFLEHMKTQIPSIIE